MSEENLICLCARCRQQFKDTGLYRLRRVMFPQEAKEPCTYCQIRNGYDYYLEPLQRSGVKEAQK